MCWKEGKPWGEYCNTLVRGNGKELRWWQDSAFSSFLYLLLYVTCVSDCFWLRDFNSHLYASVFHSKSLRSYSYHSRFIFSVAIFTYFIICSQLSISLIGLFLLISNVNCNQLSAQHRHLKVTLLSFSSILLVLKSCLVYLLRVSQIQSLFSLSTTNLI